MNSTSLVSISVHGLVSTVRLERPQALNAMSERMSLEFARAMTRIARSSSRVVILEGAGRAFCAGGDFDFIAGNMKRPRGQIAPIMRRFYSRFLAIRHLPQITIAKIQGPAVGAGFCLALACDLRVVLDDAPLGFNFVRLGLNPGMAAWPLSRRALGDARARELLLSGRMVSGRDLWNWGAASARAATRGQLDSACDKFAERLCESSPRSVRILKAEMGLSDRLDVFLRHEAKGQAEMFKHGDIVEGLAALREKRAPRF